MKFVFFIVFNLMLTSIGYGQLSAFSIQVATTNETCKQNGTAIITATNTTSGSQLLYSLYSLPNISSPISSTSQNILSGLVAGNYRVIVTQTLGTLTNTQQQDFSIVDQVIPLSFSITPSSTSNCDTTGNITVNTITGSGPFKYEIILGPLTFPPQQSNQFTGLPNGFYRIRVIDSCGAATVLDYTLAVGSPILSISFSGSVVSSTCTTIDILNALMPPTGTTMVYPLSVVYTIHPPTGPDQIITQNYPTGPPDALPLPLTLPLFLNAIYTYDIVVTDSCNHQFPSSGTIDPNPTASLSGTPDPCGREFLKLAVTHFTPPFTVNFTAAPTGFNPLSYNTAYPGPFTQAAIDFGSLTNTVPFGNYTVEITDNCGRTATASYNIVDIPLVPIPVHGHATCVNAFGTIKITIPKNRKMVSAIIISTTSTYTPIPNNVSSFISVNGVLIIPNLPIGEYHFDLVDECGSHYNDFKAFVYAFVPQGLIATPQANCTPGIGSMKVSSGNGALTSIFITTAPATFTQTLPFDASSNIVAGVFNMNNLPEGPYAFSATDACGITNTISKSIVSYNPGINNFTVVRGCGSFTLAVNDHSNLIGSSYWFQKQLNTTTNTWGHPSTGVAYPINTTPDATNSISLSNNTTLTNITYTGIFRIIKIIKIQGLPDCIEIYDSFSFSGDLDILGVYSLDCVTGSGPSSVYVDVQGVPPYLFRIIEINNVPLSPFIENGNSSIFSSLTPALYVFEVEDSCGRKIPVHVNATTLLPLVHAATPIPNEVLHCSSTSATTDVFDLTASEPTILAYQAPGNYTVTYYTSPTDADAGTNAISTPTAYTNTTSPQTIYVRVEHKTIHICYDLTSFTITVGAVPALLATSTFLCKGDAMTISADSGYDVYTWSTGATTQSILVNIPNIYTVEVKKKYGTLFCQATTTITVNPSSAAANPHFTVEDWTENENSITVHADGSGDYEYSLDDSTYQDSPIFTNLVPGIYNIFIKDKHGCGKINKEVVVFYYPNFFTPNDDGANDYWQIPNSVFEPSMRIYIFDRYGKLITGIDPRGSGWDGYYNGYQAPSTDYWFVVERANGKVYRGHFAMKR